MNEARIQAYAAIDGERDNQDMVRKQVCCTYDADYVSDFKRSTEDYLCEICYCNTRLVSCAAHQEVLTNTLDVFRELASWCVACMEANGCVPRDFDSGDPTEFIEPVVMRKKVYRVIDTELDYLEAQDEPDLIQPPSISKLVIMFQNCLHLSCERVVTSRGDEYTLDIIRKLAGISIWAMIIYGPCSKELLSE